MAYRDEEKRKKYHARWMREWRARNSEAYSKRRREAHKLNPEKRNAQRRAAYAANRHERRRQSREGHYKQSYGITIAQRDEMFAAQGSVCAACGSAESGTKKGWHVDHCHASGKVRGVLCHGCNCALGHADDDPAKLRLLADYVETHG